jgi:DNA-binding CsgD family transcriptional regulator
VARHSARTIGARRAGAIAAERLEATGDPYDLLSLETQMSQLHAFAGEPELALERCDRGLRRASGSGEVVQTSTLHQTAGFALLQQGKHQEGAQELYRALTMMAELDDIIGLAVCLEMLGWEAARQQRHDRAAWLLGAAGTQWERPGDQTVSDYPFARDPHRRAEDAAREALGAARYAAQYRAGAGYPLAQLIPLVISEADALPQPQPEQASADDPGPLTSREREIAALVAEGLANREIAERLVISKRTVDAHVEHIYTKLGISSRVQLVNWLKP